MKKKTGRPVSDNPKDTLLQIRVSKDVLEKLDELCKINKKNRSEMVRYLIQQTK